MSTTVGNGVSVRMGGWSFTEACGKASTSSFGTLGLEWRVNRRREQHHLQRLTDIVETRFTRNFHFLFDIPEESSAVLQIARGLGPLVNADSARSLGFRLFEPALLIPKQSLQLHRATQKVWVVDYMRLLGAFDVCVCVVEPVLVEKQLLC